MYCSTWFHLCYDHCSSVVSLITWNICKPHYVQETSRNLNERFSWHNLVLGTLLHIRSAKYLMLILVKGIAKTPPGTLLCIYSSCKKFYTHLIKGYSKDSSNTISDIDILEGHRCTDQE